MTSGLNSAQGGTAPDDTTSGDAAPIHPAATTAPRWQSVASATGLVTPDGTTRPTIFAEMSALAQRTGAANLGQGFPDEDGPEWIREIAAQARRAVEKLSGDEAGAILAWRGPDGEAHLTDGIMLEVVPEQRFVSTDAFRVGWIPQSPAFMVGIFAIAPEGHGTRYTATSRHWTEAAMREHEAMGFFAGWGAVADQLAALAEAG